MCFLHRRVAGTHLLLLVLLDLVVQAQLDEVQHHAQHVLGHVLVVQPDLQQTTLESF